MIQGVYRRGPSVTKLLSVEIQRVWEQNFQVYGTCKVWRQLAREGLQAARCTVERLMKQLGLRGIRRGKFIRTTVSNSSRPCPLDRVQRQFKAERPNALWVSDFTYVSSGQCVAYGAFVIDVLARCIVGWRVSASAHRDLVLDALEQALYEGQPAQQGGLIHHSDRGAQYLSIRYTGRLAEVGIKAEVIHRLGPWRNVQAVEMATLEWVDWFNHRRLFEPIGNVPPAEAEANYFLKIAGSAICA